MGGQAKKTKKMIVVVFLTLMIWVWADLETEDDVSITGIPVRISKSSDPSLRVDFIEAGDRLNSEARIKTISLKGPASRIEKIRRMEQDGTLDLSLTLNPQAESIAAPSAEPRVWSVLNFLRRSSAFRKHGVSVESCDPKDFELRIRRFAQRSLEVRCQDENGMRLETAVCVPTRIDMFVPEDWSGQQLVALVHLTAQEENSARSASIPKQPYIEDHGQQDFASVEVQVSILAQDNVLQVGNIQGSAVRLGILINPIVLSKYSVNIKNLEVVLGAFEFEATEQAKLAYEKRDYHVILLVSQESTGVQEQELLYWFPPEHEGKGEIRLRAAPQTAKYELIPRTALESSTPGNE
jgi:hypothetical protein